MRVSSWPHLIQDEQLTDLQNANQCVWGCEILLKIDLCEKGENKNLPFPPFHSRYFPLAGGSIWKRKEKKNLKQHYLVLFDSDISAFFYCPHSRGLPQTVYKNSEGAKNSNSSAEWKKCAERHHHSSSHSPPLLRPLPPLRMAVSVRE